ncbi:MULTISPECIES: ATP-binding protein [Rhodomicrobium]|uniref:hybrid sensor histidine kinase/response regulator n=1 Tax=Rhodomicrobium TaxID=1068 RepID=UPI0014837080|nr:MULTISPECIES: ATP-binding protein [Rhodomicrobium]
MTNPLNLRQVLALVISLLAFGLTGVVTLTVGAAGIRDVEEGIGASLALVADQMQDKLDRSIFERFKELDTTARLLRTFDIPANPDQIRVWLDELRSSGDDYAWIGFVRPDGHVGRATEGRYEGDDLSQRPWFRAALEAPAVGEVRDAAPEKAGPPAPGGTASARVLDIAVPVLGKQGEVTGVLAAQINWSWASEIRDSVIETLKRDKGEDILVLNAADKVILGPDEMLDRTLHIGTATPPAIQKGAFDGRHYLYAHAKTDGYRNFGGLGWTVLARQNARIALAPVHELQNRMIALGLVFSILAAIVAWWVAGHIAAPLLRLARAAQAVQRGTDTQMPELKSYAEAATLSHSFAMLVADLKQRERLLAQLNETLESQVSERTSELAVRNQALAEAYIAAEQATAAKSRFLAAASHDLRQPLHAMTLFARALSRRVHGEEAPRLVAQLEDALKSLKGMFDGLLNISRLDAGLIQPNVTDISAKTLIDRLAAGFRLEAEARGLRFVSRSVDADLRTDPVLFEAMLRNLVANAFKFTRQGGVALVARRSGRSILFQVVDTGPGIGEDRRERIFDEFERAREQAGGHNEGLGLGLSIVRRYAALLGIKIKLSSRLGRGTRFSLIVPQPPSAGNGRDLADQPLAAANGSGRLPSGLRVLVMDDDPMIVSALTSDLGDRGCAPLGATSPAEAEAILCRAPGMEAMVVDFDLGTGETGLDFCRRMEGKLLKKIPVLVLTGGTDRSTLKAVLASRLPWLTKPADPEMIAEALARLVARRDIHGGSA